MSSKYYMIMDRKGNASDLWKKCSYTVGIGAAAGILKKKI